MDEYWRSTHKWMQKFNENDEWLKSTPSERQKLKESKELYESLTKKTRG